MSAGESRTLPTPLRSGRDKSRTEPFCHCRRPASSLPFAMAPADVGDESRIRIAQAALQVWSSAR